MLQPDHKVFEASASPPDEVAFDLVTTHYKTHERQTHAFVIPGRLSAGAQLWVAQFAPNEDGTSSADAAAIMGFFQRVMPRPEFTRFVKVVDDPELSVELQALARILDYIVEKITGRPTGLSSDSSNGQSSTAPSWTAPPSAAGVTSTPSPQPGI